MNKITIYILMLLSLGSSICGDEKKKEIRVVSLSPSLTEIIFHFGKGGNLVGRSSACDYPREVKKVEIVGGFGKPSLEKLISVRPDVVIAASLENAALKRTIEQMGIRFCLLPADSINDYYKSISVIGEILNCKKDAEKEIERIKNSLKKYEAKLKDLKERPTVYFEVWDRPYMTVGKKSFINDIIRYAGGKNIAADQNKDYFNCSVEWIIRSNPDIIICPAMKTGRLAEVYKRKGWQNIEAIKSKKVFVDLNDDLVYRLGPRLLDGIEMLKKCIGNSETKE